MKTNFSPKPLRVQADPEWKGKHPLHDNRFITTGVHDIESDEFRYDPDSQIVCAMRDCQNQKQWAKLLAAAPSMLAVLKDVELLASVNCPINDGSPMHKTIQKLIASLSA